MRVVLYYTVRGDRRRRSPKQQSLIFSFSRKRNFRRKKTLGLRTRVFFRNGGDGDDDDDGHVGRRFILSRAHLGRVKYNIIYIMMLIRV